MRRHLGSIIVIAVAIALAAYAYFSDRDKVSDLERERRTKLLFPAFRKDQMVSLEIEHGPEKIRFEASDDDSGDHIWTLALPAGIKGDSTAIDRFLGALEYASYERKVPSGGTGFDPPLAKGTLVMRGITYRFELGGPATPPDGAAYFRLDGEGTFVIKSDLVTELEKGVDAFRDRNVVPLLSIDLSRLDVTGPETWSIVRVDDVSFKFAPPTAKYQGFRVSRTSLDRVWGGLAEMRADSFPKEAEAAKGLASVAFTIGMTPTSTSSSHALLVLGGPCESLPEDIVLERKEPNPLVTCVPKGSLAGIGTPIEELVDRHPFAAIPEEASEMKIEDIGGASQLELARKGNGWHERVPVDRDLSADPGDMATNLVKTITTAEGSVLLAPPLGFSPSFRVKITRAETNIVETIEVAGDVVHRLADGAYLMMPPWYGRRLRSGDAAFRNATIWPAPIDNAPVDHLASDCAGVPQDVTRDRAGAFHLSAQSKTLPVDGGNVIAVVEAIERARATSWLGKDDGSFGFDHGCSVTIDLGSDAGSARAKLTFGGDAYGGDVYARANADPAVFTVSRPLFDLAKTLFVDRSALFVDADDITEIVLSRGAKSVRLSTVRGKDAGEIGEAAAAAVGGLRADRALHVGPPAAKEGFAAPTLVTVVRSSSDAGARVTRFVIGAAADEDPDGGAEAKQFFARVDGVDASFLVSESSLKPLLDAIENHGP